MNRRSQMQGVKNWILPKETNATGSSETLIGWKSGHVPLWDLMKGAWLWTLAATPRDCKPQFSLFENANSQSSTCYEQ